MTLAAASSERIGSSGASGGGSEDELRAPPCAPNGPHPRKFHIAVGDRGKSRPPIIPIFPELTGGFSKLPPLRTLTLTPSTTATSRVRLEAGVGRRRRRGVADCAGQSVKTDAVTPLRRRRDRGCQR